LVTFGPPLTARRRPDQGLAPYRATCPVPCLDSAWPPRAGGAGLPVTQVLPDRAVPPRSRWSALRPNDLDRGGRSGGLWCVAGRHCGCCHPRARVRFVLAAAWATCPRCPGGYGQRWAPTFPLEAGPRRAGEGLSPSPQTRRRRHSACARRLGRRRGHRLVAVAARGALAWCLPFVGGCWALSCVRSVLAGVGAVAEGVRRRAPAPALAAACGRLEDVQKVLTNSNILIVRLRLMGDTPAPPDG